MEAQSHYAGTAKVNFPRLSFSFSAVGSLMAAVLLDEDYFSIILDLLFILFWIFSAGGSIMFSYN
jgi:hypothetical protein